MKYLREVSVGLVLATVPAAAWAQIYESTDKQGNPVFSDAPLGGGSSVVDLTNTNIADAPGPAPTEETSDTPAEKETAAKNNDRPAYQDPNAELWEDRVERRKEFERMDASSKPHGVLDAEPRREVRDAELRREVQDAQPRREVQDAQPRHEVQDAQPRREVR
jgi:hypothetical protein